MKKKLDKALLIALVCGSIGFLLNMVVVLSGYDSQNLPKRGFFPAIVLPWFAVAASLIPVALFFKVKGARKYLHTFTASVSAALGVFLLAACLAISGIVGLTHSPKGLTLWLHIMGIVSGLALVPWGLCRLSGKRPVWLCWAAVSVYLVLLLIGSYPLWSRQADLNRFLYQLLAGVSLMITAYQQSAADAGVGNLKEYLVLSLMCVTLCPMAIMGSSQWFLYGCFLIYHVLNLLSLDLSSHKPGEGA